MGQIANRRFANRQRSANAINSRKPFRSCTWNECYMNERQSRDSNRSTTNAGSMTTNFSVWGGEYDRQRTLVIPIAAITLASDSAITIARFRPSKLTRIFQKNMDCGFAKLRQTLHEGAHMLLWYALEPACI